MRKLSLLVVAGALLAGPSLAAQAMPSAVSASGSNASQPALVRVADKCGPGRFRGVGGYCQGHRPITVREVCHVYGAPYAAVRRCHSVRVHGSGYYPNLGPHM